LKLVHKIENQLYHGRHIGRIGGVDLGDTVRKIPSRVVEKPMSWNVTFTGRGLQEKPFSFPRLIKAIYCKCPI